MGRVKVLYAPVKGRVEDVFIEDTLKAMQALVGGMVEEIPLPAKEWKGIVSPGVWAARPKVGRVSLYVNEEGIREGLPANNALTAAFGPYLDAVLLGPGFLGATEDGNAVSLTEAEVTFWRHVLRAPE